MWQNCTKIVTKCDKRSKNVTKCDTTGVQWTPPDFTGLHWSPPEWVGQCKVLPLTHPLLDVHSFFLTANPPFNSHTPTNKENEPGKVHSSDLPSPTPSTYVNRPLIHPSWCSQLVFDSQFTLPHPIIQPTRRTHLTGLFSLSFSPNTFYLY